MKKVLLKALVANEQGEIFELDGYAAIGSEGASLIPLTLLNTRVMPFGSELMYLPQRRPVLL
ncbi:MAG: radical SAM protein, partial [Desulfobacterales bacterium]|nr:radical SAM protein [Desulfobacterales bacterium]